MSLRLPEVLPPEAVDEWIDSTVTFKVDRWGTEDEMYWAWQASAIDSDIEGAPTQSNFERAMFAIQADDEEDEDENCYEYDSQGYVTNWRSQRYVQQFKDDNEDFADQYLAGKVNV